MTGQPYTDRPTHADGSGDLVGDATDEQYQQARRDGHEPQCATWMTVGGLCRCGYEAVMARRDQPARPDSREEILTRLGVPVDAIRQVWELAVAADELGLAGPCPTRTDPEADCDRCDALAAVQTWLATHRNWSLR